ncbi:hypothetical protein FRC12_019306, partial [Ceratobasidium sp. 428]
MSVVNQKVWAQIKKIISFRDNTYKLTLRNRHSGIIHSVHWIKDAQSAVDKLH